MVNFVEPKYYRNRIRISGKRILQSNSIQEYHLFFENFRACHTYILNTFQANIRNHSRNFSVIVGQRLKRKNTIIDKLSRHPNMTLYSMHDIADCRVVFDDLQDLFKVRKSLQMKYGGIDLRMITTDTITLVNRKVRSIEEFMTYTYAMCNLQMKLLGAN